MKFTITDINESELQIILKSLGKDQQELASSDAVLSSAPIPLNVWANDESVAPESVAPESESEPELDEENQPWDGRIHATTRTKTQKGVWKKKKGVTNSVVKSIQDLNEIPPVLNRLTNSCVLPDEPPTLGPSIESATPVESNIESPAMPVAPTVPDAPVAPTIPTMLDVLVAPTVPTVEEEFLPAASTVSYGDLMNQVSIALSDSDNKYTPADLPALLSHHGITALPEAENHQDIIESIHKHLLDGIIINDE